MKLFVTGGAGFIGSSVIRNILKNTSNEVVNIDKLTYAGNLESLPDIESDRRYQLEQVDICDVVKIAQLYSKYKPDAIMHLAAESHVDRSIDGPENFIQTNIVGTYVLLESARRYWETLDKKQKDSFRFHHISTDEVYGSLDVTGQFAEDHRYEPNSPYSASKASSDHLVRAWHSTYGLPILITNCSNNYGPYQFPEKLIPLTILSALQGKEIPIYGKGNQVRDWLYVDDHAQALWQVLNEGKTGETYNIGGHNEMTNLDVVTALCRLLDEVVPEHPRGISCYEELITHVADRPGHDQRYAIDAKKIQKEMGWEPTETFDSGIRKTINWYLQNMEWCQRVQNGSYQGERLGLRETV